MSNKVSVLRGHTVTITWKINGVDLSDGQSVGGLFVYSGITRFPVDYKVVSGGGENEKDVCILSASINTYKCLSDGEYSLDFIYTKYSEGYRLFKEDKKYIVGAVVRYGDLLYKFIREHHGTWDDKDVVVLPVNYGCAKWRNAFVVNNIANAGDVSVETEDGAIAIGADGLTAYELSVIHGYEGSEIEYINQYKDAVKVVKELADRVFDGGRSDSKYGGARIVDCGKANIESIIETN